jgi:predicted thioesterase
MALEPGLSASFDHCVNEEDLAIALTSGDVPVLSTPRVIAWCEAATMAAIKGHISKEETTVGMRVRVDHVNPSGLGVMIRVSALLTRVDGRRLTFQVSAHDERSQLAMGQVIRVIVDRQRFLERV